MASSLAVSPAAVHTPSLQLTPLGRRVLAVTLLLLVIVVAGAARATAFRSHATTWRCVLVRPGDTLWEVSKRISGDDPRRVVSRIAERNDLESGLLRPGMALWVPTDDPRYRAESSECGFQASHM